MSGLDVVMTGNRSCCIILEKAVNHGEHNEHGEKTISCVK